MCFIYIFVYVYVCVCIYIKYSKQNIQLCTFWYKFSSLQEVVLGKMGFRWQKESRFWRHPTFLIALCWEEEGGVEGGGAASHRWILPLNFSSHSSLSFSVAMKTNWAQQWEEAYRMSRKVQDTNWKDERRVGSSSLGPEPKVLVLTSTLSFIWGERGKGN